MCGVVASESMGVDVGADESPAGTWEFERGKRVCLDNFRDLGTNNGREPGVEAGEEAKNKGGIFVQSQIGAGEISAVERDEARRN